jgi:phenylacetate-coenzyme A ligase PaaK-like adenylate-forming protein
MRLFASRLMIFPILEPLPSMVQRLDAFQPVIIASYPSMLVLLAHEQTAGRLQIQPLMLNSLGEGLDETARGKIEAAFPHSRLADIYAASEFLFIGFECEQHWLHVNSDWVLLEPVDEHNQPVPVGEPSANVLLTNLINRVQPLLRYALGDSVTLKPEPCPCGNPLSALRVSGRTDEILYFPATAGGMIGVLPMAIASVVEQVPGVVRYQIIQTAPAQVKVRLELEYGADRVAIWTKMAAELREFFIVQGAAPVHAILADEEPQVNPVSGKFRHVYREGNS